MKHQSHKAGCRRETLSFVLCNGAAPMQGDDIEAIKLKSRHELLARGCCGVRGSGLLVLPCGDAGTSPHRVRRICQYKKVCKMLRDGVSSIPSSRKPVRTSAPALPSCAFGCGTPKADARVSTGPQRARQQQSAPPHQASPHNASSLITHPSECYDS